MNKYDKNTPELQKETFFIWTAAEKGVCGKCSLFIIFPISYEKNKIFFAYHNNSAQSKETLTVNTDYIGNCPLI